MSARTETNAAPVSRYRPMAVLAAAFAAGACADRLLASASGTGVRFWWVASSVWLLAWWGLRWHRSGRAGGAARSSVLCLSAACLGGGWHHANWHLYRRDEIGRYAQAHPQPICIEAVALESPKRVPPAPPSPYRAIPVGARSRLHVALRAVRQGRAWRPAHGNARLNVNGQLLGIHAGDRLRLFTQIVAPYEPRNPGEFDYAAHARAERRLAELRCELPECVQLREVGAWYLPQRFLDRVRTWCLEEFTRQLGPDNGAVGAALVLGTIDGIGRDEIEAYQVTGTIHLLVVSGLHVAILFGVTHFFASHLLSSRRRALMATAAMIIFFALLTGGRPPVIRAAVGMLAVLSALGVGRPFNSWNVLAAGALVVMLINPCDLFRAGPQLSFLAAATLIGYAAWTRRRREAESPLERAKEEARPLTLAISGAALRRAGDAVAIAVCMWLLLLPLVMSQFHLFTPVAVLLAPWIGVAAWVGLTSGFALLFASWLAPFAGGILRETCELSIRVLRSSVAWGEGLPWGHCWIAGPAPWWTTGLYAGLAAMVMWGGRIPLRWKVAAFSLWLATGFGVSAAQTPPWNQEVCLECTFLSVGHGTCLVLRTPDGHCLLYDAGSLGSPDVASSAIASFLWSQGVGRLDGVVLSHSDIDHFNGVPGLLDRFSIDRVFVSPVMFHPLLHPNEASAPRQLQQALAAHDVPVRVTFAGDRLDLGGGAVAEVLHPARDPVLGGSDNAYSLVLAIEYAGRRILLTGDLESPGMEDVLAELPLDVDILLAPHHGSRFSDPPGTG